MFGMRKFIIAVLLMIFLVSCKKYNNIVEVTYSNGDKDTIEFKTGAPNPIRLDNGDLTYHNGNYSQTYASDVRKFNIIKKTEIE